MAALIKRLAVGTVAVCLLGGAAAVPASAALSASAPPDAPASAPPPQVTERTSVPFSSGRDVSGTARGKEALAEFLARAESRGQHIPADDLVVRDVGVNGAVDLVVAPRGLDGELVVEKNSAGGVRLSSGMTVEAPKGVASAGRGGQYRIMVQGYWERRYGGCFARKYQYDSSTQVGWIDTCYTINQFKYDGSNTKNIWAIDAGITFTAYRAWWVTEAYVKVVPLNHPAYAWIDFDPKGDATSNCTTFPLAVTFNGLSVGYNHQRCETWDMNKSVYAGVFRNTWRGRLSQTDRHVASHTAIETPQTEDPSWEITTDAIYWP